MNGQMSIKSSGKSQELVACLEWSFLPAPIVPVVTLTECFTGPWFDALGVVVNLFAALGVLVVFVVVVVDAVAVAAAAALNVLAGGDDVVDVTCCSGLDDEVIE